MPVKEGMLDAKGRRFGIIVSRFNEFISSRLLEGALDCIRRHGGREEDVDIVWVPGAVEIVYAASVLAEKRYDALVCLGAVIRGSTPHFDYVASQISRAVAQLNLSGKVPVAFGIITADSLEQATERAGTKMGNKGWASALSAIEMADLARRLRED